jgi:hypothetical protein
MVLRDGHMRIPLERWKVQLICNLQVTLIGQFVSLFHGVTMGRGGKGRSPNDDRSDSMNPNNPAYDASQDNTADQLNPNNPEYKGDDEEDSEE